MDRLDHDAFQQLVDAVQALALTVQHRKRAEPSGANDELVRLVRRVVVALKSMRPARQDQIPHAGRRTPAI